MKSAKYSCFQNEALNNNFLKYGQFWNDFSVNTKNGQILFCLCPVLNNRLRGKVAYNNVAYNLLPYPIYGNGSWNKIHLIFFKSIRISDAADHIYAILKLYPLDFMSFEFGQGLAIKIFAK